MSGTPVDALSESEVADGAASRPALTLLGDVSAAPICDGDVCIVPEAGA